MKKIFITVLLNILCIVPFLAQSSLAIETIGTSRISQSYSNLGFLHSALSDFDHYSFDGNSAGFSYGFSTGLLISGIDENGARATSVHTYEPQSQFLAGILDENGSPYTINQMPFNRVWSVTSEEISYVKKLFSENQITIDKLPKDIAEWPAIGNPHVSFNVSSILAPFFDSDSDNLYDPLKGDLPIAIEENENFIPSKFSFCTFHTLGDNSIEVHHIKYTLDCAERDLENSIFTRLKITKKSPGDFVDLKVGLFKDVDLGCIEDDYVGSHQWTNSIYAYNKDWIDEGCIFGEDSIPNNSTAIYSTMFLSHDLHSCIPVDFVTFAFPSPELDFEYHNILNGTFADGTPLTYGGYGFNPSSNFETNIVFPDLPNDQSGWHMNNIAEAEILDLKLIPSVDVGTMASGDSKIVDLVDVMLTFDYTDSSIFDEYEPRLINLLQGRDKALNQEIDCYLYAHCDADCVWPGDVNNNGRVEANDVVYLTSMLDDNTPNSTSRARISSDWLGFNSESWGIEHSGIDFKYGDVNGNGNVTSWDLDLLLENVKSENESYEKSSDDIAFVDPEGIGIELDSDEISTHGGFFDASAVGTIKLGNENNDFSKSIVAISYDLILDTSIVFFNPFFYINSNSILFDETLDYFEDENDPLAQEGSIQYSERYSFAHYNITESIDEGGILLNKIGITAREDGRTNNENGEEITKIEIVNIVAIDKNGNEVNIGVRISDDVLVKDLIYDPTLSLEGEDKINWAVSVHPNPVSDLLNVRLDQHYNGLLKIRNLEGRLVYEGIYDAQNFTIDTKKWSRGVYFLNFTSGNESVTRRVVKQ